MTLDELNACPAADFAAALGAVFEDAPWVAERAAALRPFPTVSALHEAMMGVISAAPANVRLDFLRGHPDLAGAAARARQVAPLSAAEQGGLGLASLQGERLARFEAMNAAYRERHGIPFILCVRRHTRASVLDQFARRLPRTTEAEVSAALREIRLITRLRIADAVAGPGMPDVAGWLTTHVLDAAAGRPAEGLRVQLFELDGEEALPIADVRTNADGRTPAPLLPHGSLRIGEYELRFHVGDHFRQGEAAFLGVVPVRFKVGDAEGHLHVPLLCSPGSYTTYRGS